MTEHELASLMFPQHDKYRPHQEDGQTIGAFLDWMSSIGIWRMRSVDDGWQPDGRDIQHLLAEYFDIDYEAYQAEKEALYKAVSALANAPKSGG